MCKLVNISPETYHFVKRYAQLKQTEDNLCKSLEDRLLDLLFIRLSSEELNIQKLTLQNLGQIPFNLRPQTLRYLKQYAANHNFTSFDAAISHLLEKEINLMQITKMNQELEGLHIL